MQSRKWLLVGSVVCAVLGLVIAFTPTRQRTVHLPDGSVLKFQGAAFGTNVYYVEGKLMQKIRSLVPQKLQRRLGFNLGRSWNPWTRFRVGRLFLRTGFLYVPADIGLNNVKNIRNELRFRLDDEKPVQPSRAQASYSGRTTDWIIGDFSPTNALDLDVLKLQVLTRDHVHTNNWKVLAEIPFKNPIPKKQQE